MNMVIRTGTALAHDEDDIRYARDRADHRRRCRRAPRPTGLAFVWYSPVPYCLFNPVQAGLGSKSCACVDGLLSVEPDGRAAALLQLRAGHRQPAARAL